MAALAGDLTKQILGQSDAAKAFRPWWDNMEDGLMYALVIMGMVTLPMTFLSGTPLDCTVHPSLWILDTGRNQSAAITMELKNFMGEGVEDTDLARQLPRYARFLRSYSKKYCTEMHVSPFLLYFPFSMFLVPLVVVFVERLFISSFNSDTKMEQFWTLLLKNSLEREDVATLEQENIKNSHEIEQAFRNSSSVYDSYFLRTVVELAVAVGLFAFYCVFNSIDGIANALFDCDVHGIPHKCIIPNSRFFWVTYFLALILLVLYIACTAYNLLWLLHPHVSLLKRILSGMKRRSSSSVDALDCVRVTNVKSRIKRDAPEVRLDMYFSDKGKDFGLLMNLLAETAGLAHTFRILAVFDKHFQRQWRVRNVKVIVGEDFETVRHPHHGSGHEEYDEKLKEDTSNEKFRSLWVLWNDASIAPYMARANRRGILEYTVDISPCVEAPVKSVLYHDVPELASFSAGNQDQEVPTATKALLEARESISFYRRPERTTKNSQRHQVKSTYKYSTRFDGLLDGTEYTIALSTELDGKTITQVTMLAMKGCSSSGKSDKSDKKDAKS